MRFEESYSYDDVLLKPKFSNIKSRSDVNLSVELGKGFKFNIPFIPSPMKSIINKELLKKIYGSKGLGLLHRFSDVNEQLNIINELFQEFGDDIFNFIGVSIGVKSEDYKNIEKFKNIGIKIFNIDIAHSDSIQGLAMTKHIATKYSNCLLVVGSIATGEAAERAFRYGADIVRVGIGCGSICSTRLETAAGVGQLSAIMEVFETKNKLEKELGRKLSSIADGGLTTAGSCVKALCFSDMVILGSYFAGCDESPGEDIEVNGQKLKSYQGSSTYKSSRIEGVKAAVHKKGSIDGLFQKLIEGVQSGCSYQGVSNLEDLKKNPSFIRITNAALIESKIHSVILI